MFKRHDLNVRKEICTEENTENICNDKSYFLSNSDSQTDRNEFLPTQQTQR